MAQQEKVRPAPAQRENREKSEAAPPVLGSVAAPAEDRSRANPWLIGGLVGMTLAFLTLAGWTTYQRFQQAEATRLATSALRAWDAAKPGAFADVYDANAVVVGPDGKSIVGVDAIATAARDRGPDLTVTQFGDVSVSRDGAYVTASYRFTGDGHGVGVSMMEIANGKIIRQWNYEPSSARATARP
jgi:hypothetical protein